MILKLKCKKHLELNTWLVLGWAADFNQLMIIDQFLLRICQEFDVN